MKIAEIKEIPTNDLVERVEAEVTNYNQMVLNCSSFHWAIYTAEEILSS